MKEPPLYPGQPFLPHLGRLITQLEMTCVDAEERRRLQLHLEHLPYTLRAAQTAIEQLVLTANDVLAKHRPQQQGDVYMITAFYRDRLNFFVDTFLDAARRIQNAVIPYISRRYSLSLPNSLNHVMKRLASGSLGLPEPIEISLHSYWHRNGKQLKAYRDLAQHHALVASDARVFLGPGGRAVLYMALPNNPEVKNASKLSYDPLVHAYEYVEAEFMALIRTCHHLVLQMIDHSVTPRVGISFRFKDALQLGSEASRVGCVIPTIAEFEQTFTHLLTELNAILKTRQERDGPSSA